MTAGMVGDLALGLVSGVVLAALHLLLLRRAADWFSGKKWSLAMLLGGSALRLGLILAGFAAVAWAAKQPGIALLAALVGYGIVRTLVLRRELQIKR